ncbi:MAG TPA: cell envelope integrity protein TolA [Steroidobacteraceae bacterium]|jgi:colicin import membrane protein|nr:cell envelope integrity protein TolA [Steroidobacteraceae bacterium]
MAQQKPSDRWVSIGLSVLLHGALLAAVVYGWWAFRQPSRPAPTLAIEGTVVDARSVPGLVKPPQPAASPVQQPPEEPVGPPAPPPQAPPAEPEGPPPPTPEELTLRQQQEQQAAEQAAEKAAADKAAAHKAEVAKAAEEKAAAQRAAQAAAADRSAALADLQRSLAAEEHADSVRSSGALASWQAAIAAKITRAWLRPPTAKAGIDCMLNVTQVPGGEVTEVSIGECNGDQAVRESIQAAVYRASPLPAPPDPSLFDRNLIIRFKPD